jgi:uroporphyrinogen decarboxylase
MTTPINRERILASLHGEVPDVVGIAEMIFWPETVERWRQEGLPPETDPGAYFGVDSLRRSIVPDLTLQMEPRVVREDEHVIFRFDANGVTRMEKKGSYTPPVEVDFTIKGREDWLKVKPRMKPDESRIPPDYQERYDADRAVNSVLLYKNPDPCWATFKVLGYEQTLVKMAEDPEFVQDMLSTFTDLIIGLYEILEGRGLKFDVAWFNSDICYRSGMVFSPHMYERLVLPFHQRLTAYFKARGIPTVFHTCGNVQQLIPLYIKAGVRGLHPLEARAGNDVREFRHLYGNQMVFIGNISVDRLSESKEEVEAEICSKIPVDKEGGAYIFHSDHSIPPTVSLENYRYALQLAQEYGRIH